MLLKKRWLRTKTGTVTHTKISHEYVIKKRWLRGHARNWDMFGEGIR